MSPAASLLAPNFKLRLDSNEPSPIERSIDHLTTTVDGRRDERKADEIKWKPRPVNDRGRGEEAMSERPLTLAGQCSCIHAPSPMLEPSRRIHSINLFVYRPRHPIFSFLATARSFGQSAPSSCPPTLCFLAGSPLASMPITRIADPSRSIQSHPISPFVRSLVPPGRASKDRTADRALVYCTIAPTIEWFARRGPGGAGGQQRDTPLPRRELRLGAGASREKTPSRGPECAARPRGGAGGRATSARWHRSVNHNASGGRMPTSASTFCSGMRRDPPKKKMSYEPQQHRAPAPNANGAASPSGNANANWNPNSHRMHVAERRLSRGTSCAPLVCLQCEQNDIIPYR